MHRSTEEVAGIEPMAVLAAARVRFDLMLSTLDAARRRGEVPRYLEAPLADLLARLEAAGFLEPAVA